MSWDNQGYDGDEGGNEQLTRPHVALEEETCERQDSADDAANGLGLEAQDDTREEAA